MTLPFHKYQGTGNDFIIMDNRESSIELNEQQIRRLCDRRFGIGGDGLMLLNKVAGIDFGMKYFNADGMEGSMCGNGGRCLTRFAYTCGIHKDVYHFIAVDGLHESCFGEHGWIHLKMTDVTKINQYKSDFVLNTGSPHYVKIVGDVLKKDVYEEGKEIRYSKEFEANGINVNFVQSYDKEIMVRTYERGVEAETLSCGTGVTACALVFAHNENGFNRIEVKTKGGHLAVEFEKTGPTSFENIWLCGPAEFVFKGEVEL